FVGQVYGIVDMSFTIAFIALPATIFIIGIARWSVGADHLLFYHRLILGLWIGVASVAVYDLVRLIVQSTPLVHFNAFATHAKFGAMLLHQPSNTLGAKIAGWSYHTSNGVPFAMWYTLVAGRARWWIGVIYALVLQSFMVLMYPRAFGLSPTNKDFLTIAFIGHTGYGAALGLLNRKFNIDEDDWERERGLR